MLTRPSVAASKYNLALLRRQRNETDIARQLFRECEQIYWELLPTAGIYWECVSEHMYRELVRGVDLLWTAENISTRRVDNSSNKSNNLVTIMFILAVVPLSVIVCFVLYNCVRLCSRGSKDQNDNNEETPLIK